MAILRDPWTPSCAGDNASPLTETLTESFCERCGTRYEFKAPTRLNPLRKTRGFIGGLKNYLTSQDDLADAMGDARRSEEDGLAAAQLEAFHESFNFCIDCRQYTCLNCWNDDAGRCRSCVPIPGTDDLAERLAAPPAATGAGLAAAAEPLFAEHATQSPPGLDAWPTSDLPTAAAAIPDGSVDRTWTEWGALPLEAEVEPEAEPMADAEPDPAIAESHPEPMLEPSIAPEPVAAAWEPAPIVAEAEPEPVVADLEPEPEPERAPLRVVAWDEDAAYEVIEPEPVLADVQAEIELEPAVAEIEPEPAVAEVEDVLEPEPMVSEAEPEPAVAEVEVEVEVEVEPEPEAAETELEPVVAEAEREPERRPRMTPISDTILPFPPRPTPTTTAAEDERAAAVADTPELAARRAQLDKLGLGDPGQGPVVPDRPHAQPYRSRGAAVTPAEIARQAALRGSFWEASAREVAGAAGQIGVQSCGQCGLSLSANARFCRRCGTSQARSA